MDEFETPPAPADRGVHPGDDPRGHAGGDTQGDHPRPRRRRGFVTIVAGLAIVTAVAASLAVVYGFHIGGRAPSGSSGAGSGTAFNVTRASALARPASTSAIAARVDPGLVNINVTDGGAGVQGAATGMVLTPSGVVLTNNHVVQGATRITASDVGNGRTYAASVVGYDRSGDVAVIQLQGASGLETVPLGDSSTVTPAARVTALGNAGGGGGTPRVAVGAVTALQQTITASDIGGGNAEQLGGLIQTNAAVLPGDSGGPLVNDAGQVVGMDAAASSANASFISQSSAAQGFAIPIDAALAIARQIEAGVGSATVHVGPTGFLGVEVVPSPQSGDGYAYSAGSPPQGALLGGVLSGYPAAQIGLAQGDLITSVDGQAVSSATGLTDLLSAHHPGDSVRLQWTDSTGQTHAATVKLASGPPA
jgi:S1-C subfamily serine protease